MGFIQCSCWVAHGCGSRNENGMLCRFGLDADKPAEKGKAGEAGKAAPKAQPSEVRLALFWIVWCPTLLSWARGPTCSGPWMQAELLEQLEKKKARAARFNLPVQTTGQEVREASYL